MISKTKIYGINTLKILILILIIVFIFHPLSVTPESVCSIMKKNTDTAKCCCCSDTNDCCGKNDCNTGDNSKIFCMCELNNAEPAEEQKNPVNINPNIQKLIAGIKSDLYTKPIDSDIKESLNFLTTKTNIPSIKYGIYLEISSLRI